MSSFGMATTGFVKSIKLPLESFSTRQSIIIVQIEYILVHWISPLLFHIESYWNGPYSK